MRYLSLSFFICFDTKMTDNKKITWFFSGMEFNDKNHKAGDVVEIQIMRVGKWQHPEYGFIEVTQKDLSEFKYNFDNRVRGVDLAVDENHEEDHKALGWFKELNIKGDKLFAKIELTAKGAELVNNGAYKYFSPEYIEEYVDEETGDLFNNLLLGGAFTNRPFFKGMKPLMASEVSSRQQDGNKSNDFIILFNNKKTMKEIKEFSMLLSELKTKEVISEDDKASLEKMFSELPEAYQGEDGFKKDYENVVKKFTDEGGKGEEPEVEEKEKEEEKEEVKEEVVDGEKKEEEKEEEVVEEEVEEVKEEEKPEEKVEEEEVEEKKEEVVEASEKEVSIKASELATLKGKISQYETQITMKETTDKVESLVCSENNVSGKILPKQKNDLVNLLVSLSAKKRDEVLEFVGNLPAIEFKEIGADGADVEEKDPAEELNKKAEKYAEKNGVGFDVALKEVSSKNPSLFKKYKDKY